MERKAKKGRTPEQWISYLQSKGAPKKLLDQIRSIEESGKEYDRSKEYTMRTIIDKIPKKYLDDPSKVHGPRKSGPKSEPSKKKSNIELSLDDYFDMESFIRKIAHENDIENIKEVNIAIYPESAIMQFEVDEDKQ